jgi:hypothetical protein
MLHSFLYATTTRPSVADHPTSMTAARASTSATLRTTTASRPCSSMTATPGKPSSTWATLVGWDAPYGVVDGAVPDLVLSETERLWVRACWQAATANAKEV